MPDFEGFEPYEPPKPDFAALGFQAAPDVGPEIPTTPPPNARYAKPGPYITELDPKEEAQFQQWVKSNKIPFDPSPSSDYDMRGYWKDIASKGKSETAVNQYDNRIHFPDTYKTPYHESFSNESKYANENAPRWVGNRYLVDPASGTPVFDDKTGRPLGYSADKDWKPLPFAQQAQGGWVGGRQIAPLPPPTGPKAGDIPTAAQEALQPPSVESELESVPQRMAKVAGAGPLIQTAAGGLGEALGNTANVAGLGAPPNPWDAVSDAPQATGVWSGALTPERAAKEMQEVEPQVDTKEQAPSPEMMLGAAAITPFAPEVGGPILLNELAQPFIHHYVGKNVEEATGSPTAGAIADVATPFALTNAPRALSSGVRMFAGMPSGSQLEEVGTKAADEATKALDEAKENIGDLTNKAYGAASEDVGKQVAPIAKQQAEAESTSQILGGMGVSPEQRAAEAEAPLTGNTDLQRQADLARRDATQSAIKPVGRLIQKKGQQMGALLDNKDPLTGETYKDLPVSSENLGDTIGSINSTLEKNAYDVSPAVQKEIEQAQLENSAGTMTAGQAMGRLQKMQTMIGGLRGGRNESGDRLALGRLREAYQNQVDSFMEDLPPEVQKEYGNLKGEYGTLKSAFDTHARDIYSAGDQVGVAKQLLKLNKDDLAKVVGEANPTERQNIANTFGRYVMGNEEKPDADAIIKRFNEVRSKNPAVFRTLYGDSAAQSADNWADVATKTQKFTKDLRSNKDMAFSLASGSGLAQNSPEAQALDAAKAKFEAMTKPQQAATMAKLNEISDASGGRMSGYIKRRLVFDTLLYGGSAGRYGMLARSPLFAMGVAGYIGSREAAIHYLTSNPEVYLNMVNRMNGTVQGMRQVGYFGARLTMAEMAHELDQAMGQEPTQGKGQ
jgi:hypothetical protein